MVGGREFPASQRSWLAFADAGGGAAEARQLTPVSAARALRPRPPSSIDSMLVLMVGGREFPATQRSWLAFADAGGGAAEARQLTPVSAARALRPRPPSSIDSMLVLMVGGRESPASQRSWLAFADAGGGAAESRQLTPVSAVR